VTADSLDRSYFEDIYARDRDPWRFATSAYERRKYRRTLSVLTRGRYRSALEVGCSIGVLTRQLAERCDRLEAVDIAAAPLAEARRRCADAPWVHIAQKAAPREWPEGLFDLIVLSEVVYYLSVEDVTLLGGRITAALATGGDLLLVHWIGPTNYPLSGDKATDLLLAQLRGVTTVLLRERHQAFRLDLVSRR
jgi:cyclopropane fatty-acyl-phospholipid synthase-like methyltransferase